MKAGIFKGPKGNRYPKHTGKPLIPVKTLYFNFLAEEIS